MSTGSVRTIGSWILAVLLALGFFLAALGKLSGAATSMFEGWGYAPWFATLIGVLELLGAITLLVPRATRYAVIGLTAIMLGAAYTHLVNGEAQQLVRPGLFLALLWVLWWLRRPGRSADGSAETP